MKTRQQSPSLRSQKEIKQVEKDIELLGEHLTNRRNETSLQHDHPFTNHYGIQYCALGVLTFIECLRARSL